MLLNPAPSSREILRANPLFAALDKVELDSLASCCGIRSFSQGEILFCEGDQCAGLYILVNGSVRIFKTSVNGREQVLAVEGPPASIAELPIFDGGSYPASASALENTEALFLSRTDLRAICLEHPEVSLKLLQVVGGRLRKLVGIIEELSFTTVRHRLVSWILRHSLIEGQSTERGVRFSLNANHQELAAQIGTVRELVSRNLTRLVAQKFIEMQGREITILDREGLEAELSN